MYQSPQSGYDNGVKGSSESKKRKSLTQTVDPDPYGILRNVASPSSPVTSEDSNSRSLHAEIRKSTPTLNINTQNENNSTGQLDSDGTTEEETNRDDSKPSDVLSDSTHSTKGPASSNVFSSPGFMEKIEEEIAASAGSSNKKARFNDDLNSPKLNRQRSYTFSTSSDYTKQQPVFSSNPLDALSWFASIAESEANAVKSLFQLSHSTDFIEEGNEEEEDEEGEGEDEEGPVEGEGNMDEGEEEDEDEEGDPHTSRYVDPYLVNESTSDGKILLNQNESTSTGKSGAISYFQSFQMQSKQWTSNPFSDPNLFQEPNATSTADRLQLLTNSAGYLASPVTRRTLAAENGEEDPLVLKLQFRHPSLSSATTATTTATSSTFNGTSLINFSERSMDHHYLDTMETDMQNLGHAGRLFTGRARSASMSILEGAASSFDNPALARLKGKSLYTCVSFLCNQYFFSLLGDNRELRKENSIAICSKRRRIYWHLFTRRKKIKNSKIFRKTETSNVDKESEI